MLETVLFYIFSAGAIASALGVVSSRSAVHGVLWLVAALCAISGLFILLKAFLVATILILVYAGAILVLFLFVIMMMDIRNALPDTRPIPKPSLLAAILFSILIFIQSAWVIRSILPTPISGLQGTAETVGLELFSHYVLPFELTSFLLLAAVTSVVVLAKKNA